MDIAPAASDVLAHDLLQPLPFADRSFDFVYHSHVLEHFRRDDAAPFLAECLRVLRRGGVLRVVVPDLEMIARGYLDALDRCRDGETAASHDYEWMMLELYDQTVREHSGGRMAEYLSTPCAFATRLSC